jgi:hypothetical protein
MGGLVYVIGTKVMQRFLPARPGRHPEQEGVD